MPDAESTPRLPYDFFATAYSHIFGPEAAGATWQALEQLLLPELEPAARVLDLCCGTGELAHQFERRGYHVVGLDNSPGMLTRARQRAPRVEFIQADVRDFHLSGQFSAVVSTYNSLSHLLTRGDLEQCFSHVRAALAPGGLFVFDIYSERAYRERWRGTFAKITGQDVCVVQPSFDESSRTGVNHVTAFHRDESAGALWIRTDVQLVTRCYSDDEIQAHLAAAGFKNVEHWEGTYGLGIAEASERVFWRCRVE
ncbi:MAG: class I SAM-dependent methyltransferase [Acidobacteriales bacterium]|nr:class I SAM-dependent methyltransferase [Terriglobales bacterium]